MTNLVQHEYWLSLVKLKKEYERLCLEAEPSVLLHHPEHGGWNVFQLTEHILNSEGGTLRYIKNKIKHTKNFKKSSIHNNVSYLVLKMALQSRFKFKAPKVVLPSAENTYSDFQKLLNEWTTIRQDFEELLHNLPSDLTDKLIFKHPIAGRFNIFQTLGFMYYHLEHHLPQLKRLLKD